MDEALKQKALISFIAFNVVVILFQMLFNSGLFGSSFSWFKFLLAIVLGLLAAAITFGVAHAAQR